MTTERLLLSGNEAIALAALHLGFALGTGYPGTPSTEILEALDRFGGRAQWAPNEKVALEVGLGVAFARARALVTMKHVGVNVAADPLFTAAYTGVSGALVLISADDPGMASSQNEQDNRRFALAAAIPMLEPSDSQEAYDFLAVATEISERWKLPVMVRMTTRVCHSKSVLMPRTPAGTLNIAPPRFDRDPEGRVMVPAHARPAHRRLRKKLAEIQDYAEASPLTLWLPGSGKLAEELGVVTSGVAALHAMESAPGASFLKLGLTYPLPLRRIAEFARSVKRCVVIEEGDPYLVEALSTAGIRVEGKPESFRFGELNPARVRRLLARDETPELPTPKGKPPELCKGCPHRVVFGLFAKHDLIVSGDIGCYTLGALPPINAMDTCVCMGASIGIGLGLRQALPPDQAKRVISVIGDSTFVHSGLTGVAEMVYNRPATGHVVVIVDNGTTAMTGQQEHPGTGRTLAHSPTQRLSFEAVTRAMGVDRVEVMDPCTETERFEHVLLEMLQADGTAVLIARRPCLLAARQLRAQEKAESLPDPGPAAAPLTSAPRAESVPCKGAP